ncbi:MAG: hypothetical protein V4564_11950 [Pseudomonadota bacterium]|uniref:hypothetical protein n=1 Tax=Sphingomonas sp. ERG5 TaxID=1381597 RepID=UPI00054BDCB9|nr:hypothetical protein [Sphingomonas sp. ERG5]
MLCCGFVALLAAMILGLWRRLRAQPRMVMAGLTAMLALVPIVALAATVPGDQGMTRADVIAASLRSMCGAHFGGAPH